MADRRFGPSKVPGRGLVWLVVGMVVLVLAGLGLEHGGGSPLPVNGVLSSHNQPGAGGGSSTSAQTNARHHGGGDDAKKPDTDCDTPQDMAAFPSCQPHQPPPKMSGGHQRNVCSPNIQANPNHVSSPDSTTITISGNCRNDRFNVTFFGTPNSSTTITTNGQGMGTGTLAIPGGEANGQHNVTAQDIEANFASTTVTVGHGGPKMVCNPNVHAQPNNVKAGSSTTIRIDGNCMNDSFTVTLDNSGSSTTVSTDSHGNGSGSLLVPAGMKKGQYSVSAVDSSGNGNSTKINVK